MAIGTSPATSSSALSTSYAGAASSSVSVSIRSLVCRVHHATVVQALDDSCHPRLRNVAGHLAIGEVVEHRMHAGEEQVTKEALFSLPDSMIWFGGEGPPVLFS